MPGTFVGTTYLLFIFCHYYTYFFAFVLRWMKFRNDFQQTLYTPAAICNIAKSED